MSACDTTNKEHCQAAQLIAHYMDRGYVHADKKEAQRARPDFLPAVCRDEIQFRYPHFTGRELDGVMKWGRAAGLFRDMFRRVIRESMHTVSGKPDGRYWDLSESQRADFLHLLDQNDIHQMQRNAGIPVDEILAAPEDE